MQTAIEWLIEELKKVHHPTEAMIMYAKKLEKQQIIDANSNGWHDGQEVIMNMLKSIDFVEKGGDDNGEQYYNETYGSKGSDDHIVDTTEMVEDTFKVWECCGVEECICKGSDATSSQTDENGKPLTYWGGVDFSNKNAHLIKSNTTTSSQTEISDDRTKLHWKTSLVIHTPEISDEEIEEMLFHHSNEYAYGFKDAIQWYREQLKQQQCKQQ